MTYISAATPGGSPTSRTGDHRGATPVRHRVRPLDASTETTEFLCRPRRTRALGGQDRGLGVAEASVQPATGTVEDRERLAARIGVPMNVIKAFCDRWQVEELALFGSVLRNDFGPDSDIDVLVRLRTERTPGLFGIAGMERELAELLARRVDLVNRAAIDGSRNYIRRKAILESARVVYAP